MQKIIDLKSPRTGIIIDEDEDNIVVEWHYGETQTLTRFDIKYTYFKTERGRRIRRFRSGRTILDRVRFRRGLNGRVFTNEQLGVINK